LSLSAVTSTVLPGRCRRYLRMLDPEDPDHSNTVWKPPDGMTDLPEKSCAHSHRLSGGA
jgi:hypothetical protein